MNTNYRIVWNEASRKWVVASELAGRKKKAPAVATLAIAMVRGLGVASQAAAQGVSVSNTGSLELGPGHQTGLITDTQIRDAMPVLGPGPQIAVITDTQIRDALPVLGPGPQIGVGELVHEDPLAAAKIEDIDARENKDASTIVKGMANIDGRVNHNAADIAKVDARENKDASMIVKGMANIDGRVSSVQQAMDQAVVGAGAKATGTNSIAVGPDASATGNNAVALGNGSAADRDNSVSVGSPGHERQITNVAAGTQRTDAANWGQVQDAVADEHNWANREFRKVDRRIDGMGAMTAAYGQMAFNAAGVDAANRIGAGIGYQNGQSALAIGISHRFGQRVNLSFGAASTGHDTSMGAGVAVGW